LLDAYSGFAIKHALESITSVLTASCKCVFCTQADTGEFVEITGPTNTDLTGYKLYLYNGAGGATYSPTTTLSGVLDGTAFGAKSFLIPGLQNGNPDGLALVSPAGAVLEFLSYGGVFTATSGPAINTVSKDIGVTEPSTAAIGSSVRKTGDARLSPGTWQFGTASAGTLNSGKLLFVFKLHAYIRRMCVVHALKYV
jgi:hypothetical protein